jgi:hypothetical protein
MTRKHLFVMFASFAAGCLGNKVNISYHRLVNASHAERGRSKILLGRLRKKLTLACLGHAQVFLGLRKVGMKTQRFFELRDCL